MMREKTIERIIREFIAKELTMSPEKILPESNLVNDLHADSMDIVNVVTAIESRFKITFPDDSQIPYEGYTLRFLVEGVQQALREKAPARRAARAAANVEKAAEERAERIHRKVKEAKMKVHAAEEKAAEPAPETESAPETDAPADSSEV